MRITAGEVDMKKRNRLTAAVIVVIVLVLIAAMSVAAQTPDDAQKARPRTTTTGQDKDKKKPVAGERLEPDDASRSATDVPDDVQANRQEQISEEARSEERRVGKEGRTRGVLQ